MGYLYLLIAYQGSPKYPKGNNPDYLVPRHFFLHHTLYGTVRVLLRFNQVKELIQYAWTILIVVVIIIGITTSIWKTLKEKGLKYLIKEVWGFTLIIVVFLLICFLPSTVYDNILNTDGKIIANAVFITFRNVSFVLLSFYISKYLFKYGLRNNKEKASIVTKILGYASVIFIIGVITAAIINDLGSDKYWIKYITLLIPALFGGYRAYNTDSKLTSEQRNERNYELNKKTDNDTYPG